jgi:drug/metabolite transporter (DMT)-like permease
LKRLTALADEVFNRPIFKNGIFNMLIAAAFLAIMGAITKALGRKFPSVELVFFRGIVGTALIAYTVYQNPFRHKGGKFGMLVFRGLIGSLSLFAFFYCITKINLALANTYSLTYPVFIGIFSAMVLRRPLSKIQWLATLLGFIGVLLIFRPDLNFPLKFHLLGLFSGMATAVAYIAINRLSTYYDHRATVLSFLITGLALSSLSFFTGLFYQNPDLDFILSPFVMPSGAEWFWLLLMGFVAMWAQIFLTRGLSYGKPTVVGPVHYMQIPFALLLGLFLGDSLPDLPSLAGIAIIIGSGILITVLTHRTAKAHEKKGKL